MKKKAIVTSLIVALLSATLTGCGSSKSASTPADSSSDKKAGEKIVMKLANPMAPGDAVTVGLELFAQKVAEKSNGQMEVQVYGSAVLGSDRATAEQCQMGNIEFASVASPNLAGFIPTFMAWDLPFIVPNHNKDNAQILYDAIDGEVGDYFRAQAEDAGFKIVMFSEYGYRRYFAKDKELTGGDSLAGLKIRCTESLVDAELCKAFGAQAMPLGWAEVYTALEQGTLDAEDNAYSLLHTAGHTEILKYGMDSTAHYAMHTLLMNKEFYDNLSPENQKIIDEAAKEALAWQRPNTFKVEEETIKAIEAKGIKIHRLTAEEKQYMIDKTKYIYDLYPNLIKPEAIKLIQEALKAQTT